MQIGNHHQLCFGCCGACRSHHTQNRQEHRRDPFHGAVAKPFFHAFFNPLCFKPSGFPLRQESRLFL
jgi:hypothetical protein